MQPQRVQILSNSALLIQLIEKLLTDLLEETKTLQRGNSIFHCQKVPSISIGAYLNRIAKFANCSHSVFILALIYIDRMQQRQQGFICNYFCIHRLLICGVMLAAKFLDDFYFRNEYYARIGGITKSEMNLLEVQMWKELGYSLLVEESEFQVYVDKLQVYCQTISQ